ncbi:MAG: hypothetical protein HGA80_02540 [Candidatus Omnitrophica bacterium]|nr:hypothetical protein [Candidatus Omnitrophota bacterium]
MSLTENNERGHSAGRSWVTALWCLAAFASLAVVLAAFLVGKWTWGLMDDYKYIAWAGTFWDKVAGYMHGTLGNGKFCPVYVVHSVLFYGLFGKNAGLFYIFRWAEVAAALGVWGWLAAMVTRRTVAVPLLVCIALSFGRVYDAFFYLSTPEIIGVFFSGCAGIFLFRAFEPAMARRGEVVRSQLIIGAICLILACGSREMFLAVAFAWGLSLVVVGLLRPRRISLWASGLVFLTLSVVYGFLLKLFVSKGYTSAYNITDFSKMISNILIWVRQDVVPHIPWIVGAALCMLVRSSGTLAMMRVWALVLGVVSYLVYLGLLLPWETVGYYSTPLGVFFAFVVTVLVAERLEKISVRMLSLLAMAAVMLNLYVGGTEIYAAMTYQQDTDSLSRWMVNNVQFEYEVGSGSTVRINASEPSDTIPMGVNLVYGKSYKKFIFSPRVREVLSDQQTRYYLYGPNWGDQDLSRLGRIWYPVFQSKNWVMFRRLY